MDFKDMKVVKELKPSGKMSRLINEIRDSKYLLVLSSDQERVSYIDIYDAKDYSNIFSQKKESLYFIMELSTGNFVMSYEDGKIEIKAKIPAISKTLMSQTKNYRLPIEKTIVKSYILKKSKFITDLHTHMNANLTPDLLIALGIAWQIKYPLYYIKKLNLIMSKTQEKAIFEQRKKVEEEYKNCGLIGKYFTRKIDDNTFINFADFILNNLENAEYNIAKIRNSLAILKDGQAVFTNLEKV